MTFTRREKIRKMLTENGNISLSELSSVFPDVSEMTLRRDLEYFEEQGVAVRVRGGARLLDPADSKEPSYIKRVDTNKLAKEKIAFLAAKYVSSGSSVYIDSGTTAMALAKILPDINLNILTSGPNIAMELSNKRNININMTGGNLSRSNLSLSGPSAMNCIELMNIDTAFIVTSGLAVEGGFTCGDYNECTLKKAVIKKARTVILLADSSKVGKLLPFTFAKPEDIDVIITDKPIPDDVLKAINKDNTIIICD